MAPDPVADELAVRALVAHFADVVNRRAFDEVGSLWAPEGVWVVPGFDDSVGVDAIRSRLEQLLGAHAALIQLVHSGRVWLDGDRAKGRFYQSELALGADGVTRLFAGCYTDDLARLEHGWRFTRRRYRSVLCSEGRFETLAQPLDPE